MNHIRQYRRQSNTSHAHRRNGRPRWPMTMKMPTEMATEMRSMISPLSRNHQMYEIVKTTNPVRRTTAHGSVGTASLTRRRDSFDVSPAGAPSGASESSMVDSDTSTYATCDGRSMHRVSDARPSACGQWVASVRARRVRMWARWVRYSLLALRSFWGSALSLAC